MGCGSSVAQELPATKTPQDVPKLKNSPKPALMRADKFLSREEARERRQQAMKEKQLQSRNNAQAISAQALIDQERLSTSTKRSLRSYASSSTTTPLKSGDNSKLFDAQNPVYATNEKNLATHSEDAVGSLSPSKQTAKDDGVPPRVIVEDSAAISSERTEMTASQQITSDEGDNKTLELSENKLEEKTGSLKESRDVATTSPEKYSEDDSLMKDGDSEIMKGESVRGETTEKNERLPEEIETGPVGITGDAKSSGNEGGCEGERGRKGGGGADEILKPNNSEDKDGVGYIDTVPTVAVEKSSVLEGQRSCDGNGGVSEVDTTSNQAARTENEGSQVEDEGTMDHHVADDTEAVKTSNRVGEDGFNDTSDGSDEGVADLGEIGEENEVEVPPTAS